MYSAVREGFALDMINGLNGLLAQASAACSAHFNISDATSIPVLLRHILRISSCFEHDLDLMRLSQ